MHTFKKITGEWTGDRIAVPGAMIVKGIDTGPAERRNSLWEASSWYQLD
jgi:hypothetical protein